jgi:hypothetical protein
MGYRSAVAALEGLPASKHGDAKQQSRKSEEPYASFPITAHPNDQSCKNIDGRHHFFSVLRDPNAALETHLYFASDHYAGRSLRKVSNDDPTVKDARNCSASDGNGVFRRAG